MDSKEYQKFREYKHGDSYHKETPPEHKPARYTRTEQFIIGFCIFGYFAMFATAIAFLSL